MKLSSSEAVPTLSVCHFLLWNIQGYSVVFEFVIILKQYL